MSLISHELDTRLTDLMSRVLAEDGSVVNSFLLAGHAGMSVLPNTPSCRATYISSFGRTTHWKSMDLQSSVCEIFTPFLDSRSRDFIVCDRRHYPMKQAQLLDRFWPIIV